MRDELLYTDRPVALPHGTMVPQPVAGGLRFSRAYRAELACVNEHWTDGSLRERWLNPMKGSRFMITHAAPAFLEAFETDGVYSVLVSIALEHDDDLTTVHVSIAPMAPITTAILISSGYADHWEERLYALTDQLGHKQKQR